MKMFMSCIASALLFAGACWSAEWHVKTTGTSGGSGSDSSPWDLATALAGPSAVHAGDTIWVHGGRYLTIATVQLTGAAGNPIVMRAYNNERVTVDINNTLTFYGAYADYRDIEVTNTIDLSNRQFGTSGSNPAGRRPNGVDVYGHHIRLINMVCHDAGQGFGIWADQSPSYGIEDEAVSCLSFHNGWVAPDRGHGHGFYIQNKPIGRKWLTDNVVFTNFGYGLHAYTQANSIDNFTFDGNVVFNAGYLVRSGNADVNIYLGGYVTANNDTYTNNMTFYSGAASENDIGTHTALIVQNNYFAMGNPLSLSSGGTTMTGNTFIGAVGGFSSSTYPNNTYLSSPPSTTKVFVKKHKYDAGRGNIVIYNWAKSSAVDVDVSSVLSAGDAYEIRDAENYYGNAVGTGTYSGGTISIPMTGLTAMAAVGNVVWQPPHTAPDFGVFLIRKTGAGSVVVYGDANGDGIFGMADINQMVDWLLSRSTPPSAGAAKFIAADVNGDSQLTMADLNLMVDRLLGRITKFPVQP
jgi:hypothetical protein